MIYRHGYEGTRPGTEFHPRDSLLPTRRPAITPVCASAPPPLPVSAPRLPPDPHPEDRRTDLIECLRAGFA